MMGLSFDKNSTVHLYSSTSYTDIYQSLQSNYVNCMIETLTFKILQTFCSQNRRLLLIINSCYWFF